MRSLLHLVRRGATLPGLRRLASFTPVIRLTGCLRATLVVESRRFAANELRPRDFAARYTLRSVRRPIVIRHHSSDVMILDEIFSAGEYEPPPQAEAILGGLPMMSVVDLGANVGLFGVWMLARHPRATIVGYEPDPFNAAVHERVIELNDAHDRWSLRQAAAAPEPGTLRFKAGHGAASHVSATDDDGLIAIPAADPFGELARCDFAKIDIEGGEWALLADPRFLELRASVLFLEYHPEGCPGEDPAKEAIRRIAEAGYSLEHTPKGTPGVGVIWAWRD